MASVRPRTGWRPLPVATTSRLSGAARSRSGSSATESPHQEAAGPGVTVASRIRSEDALMAVTVMIVDDHASFRSLARRILESEGFDVVGEAADAEAAGAMARRQRP